MLKTVIVEDEAIIRQGLILTIDWAGLGCEIVGEADDGRVGLEIIRQTQPDIVITDIKMPQLDGLQMIEAARREAILPSACKVIFLTSYAEFSYAQQAIHLQAFDYLLKPLEEEKLAELIGRIRQSGAALGEAALIDWSLYLSGDAILNSYVKEALLRINRDYQARISVEALAEEMNVSASYLSRKFKEATGSTFLELLSRQRIAAAAQLLKDDRYRVYEVAEKAGFKDYKNFCLVFKRYMCKTPKEYRNECGK